jgi:hypothetical protein
MAPLADNDRPAGRLPDASDQVYDPVPPVAASCAEYAEPTVPPASELVVTETGLATVSVRLLDAVCEPSVAATLNDEVPAALGVPVMAPLADNDRPAGRLPDASDQVYDPVPPVAASCAEYAEPTVPSARDVVVTARVSTGGGELDAGSW